jgi:hypothetical protein
MAKFRGEHDAPYPSVLPFDSPVRLDVSPACAASAPLTELKSGLDLPRQRCCAIGAANFDQRGPEACAQREAKGESF